jgi:hypothetical protein
MLVFEKEISKEEQEYYKQLDDFVLVVLHIQVANQVQLHLMLMFDPIIIIIRFLHQHHEEQIMVFKRKKKTRFSFLFENIY